MTKHTLNMFEGQMEKMQELHPRLGAAFVIRRLIDAHIAAAESGAAEHIPAPEAPAAVSIEELL